MLQFPSLVLDICLSVGSSISASIYCSTLYEYLHMPVASYKEGIIITMWSWETETQ